MSEDPVYFDPFDWDIRCEPYPVYQRLRDEAPLYFNERYGFYVLSRFDDVERYLIDKETFSSAKGSTIDSVQADAQIPPAMFIAEDAPMHTRHRAIVSILFTPKSVSSLEPATRAFCAEVLDELVEKKEFDFVTDLGGEVPMRVVGMLLGIPPADQVGLREQFESAMQAAYSGGDAEPFEGMKVGYDVFGPYLDWRETHPADDLMTELMTKEIEGADGVKRQLTRDELVTFCLLIASAGSDTTSRLIGWIGSLLAEHEADRHALRDDPSLVPNAVEEILRIENPNYHVARYVTKDVEIHGQVVPAGSAVVGLPGSANRDERQFPDPDDFDIRRKMRHHLSFGYGAHFCLGAALARLEGRVVLEEVLKRMPDWEVDQSGARLTPGFITRGWATLPVTVE